MTNKAKQPLEVVEQPEIMPADAINAADYEKTDVKPPRIQQIEQYIQKREEALLELDKRLPRLESQRPGMVFKNNEDGLTLLEQEILKVKEQQRTAQDQIAGAKSELNLEVERWIKLAIQKSDDETNALKKEADELKAKTQEYFDKIEELTGQKAIFGGALMQESIKEKRLRERIKMSGDDHKKIRVTIHKVMGM